jgi:hypothetical protein
VLPFPTLFHYKNALNMLSMILINLITFCLFLGCLIFHMFMLYIMPIAQLNCLSPL